MPIQHGAPLSLPTEDGNSVHGVACQSREQVAYHIHVRLQIFSHGRAQPVPAGIGVVAPTFSGAGDQRFAQAMRCYYWLHTHAQDGVVHIESPDHRVFTLGDFFSVWRQPLTADAVASIDGPVTEQPA